MNKKITKIVTINGVLTTKSGLSIGGVKDSLGISSEDNPIVKDSLTGNPYIPGTSIKGKMRSLFESSGFAKGNNLPCGCGRTDCMVCTLFGAHRNIKADSGQTRLQFMDAFLTKDFEDIETVVEDKIETAIDRQTGTAAKGSLRTRERISAGVSFDYEIRILIFEGDDENKFIEFVKLGLKMIESTGLGCKNSSGYGQVDFNTDKDSFKIEIKKFTEV